MSSICSSFLYNIALNAWKTSLPRISISIAHHANAQHFLEYLQHLLFELSEQVFLFLGKILRLQ